MGWKAVKDHYQIGHIVQITDEGLCIGSPYIHDIITVTADEIKTCRGGVTGNTDLVRYWNEFNAEEKTLRELIAQPDEFEKSITVYTYENGEILQFECEELGWPNVTHCGRMMYANTFSDDLDFIYSKALEEAEAGVRFASERLATAESDLDRAREYLKDQKQHVLNFTDRKPPVTP